MSDSDKCRSEEWIDPADAKRVSEAVTPANAGVSSNWEELFQRSEELNVLRRVECERLELGPSSIPVEYHRQKDLLAGEVCQAFSVARREFELWMTEALRNCPETIRRALFGAWCCKVAADVPTPLVDLLVHASTHSPNPYLSNELLLPLIQGVGLKKVLSMLLDEFCRGSDEQKLAVIRVFYFVQPLREFRCEQGRWKEIPSSQAMRRDLRKLLWRKRACFLKVFMSTKSAEVRREILHDIAGTDFKYAWRFDGY